MLSLAFFRDWLNRLKEMWKKNLFLWLASNNKVPKDTFLKTVVHFLNWVPFSCLNDSQVSVNWFNKLKKVIGAKTFPEGLKTIGYKN